MRSVRLRHREKTLRSVLVAGRQKKSVTQAQLAELLGRPQSFVSKYESGERGLGVAEMLEICEAIALNPLTVIRAVLYGNQAEET